MSVLRPTIPERDQLEVTCPKCYALPGEWCVRSTGPITQHLHAARLPMPTNVRFEVAS